MSFQVNRAAWDKLPSDYQEAFRTAAIEAAAGTLAIYDAKNPAALERLIAEGVQLRPFSAEIMRAAQTASNAILEDSASKDASYRKVYDAWKKFREDSFRWFATSEQRYAQFTFGSQSNA
jgi:TRAP-type mannitol/chloroaromatic compound transport system substrate-binding protein